MDDITYRERQGEAIRSARKERNLTQRDVARLVANQGGRPVTVQSVSKWEQGAVPARHFQVALATVLGVSWSDLFGLDDEVA